jgi:hypothetical protein
MYRSQALIVQEHMEKHGSITSMEAFRLYDITRLSAAIFVLRRSGVDVGATIEVSNKSGRNKYFKRYFIIKEEK